MDNHNTLFYNLTHFVRDTDLRFPDLRLSATFMWAVVGLNIGETIHLNHWAIFRPGTAQAASQARQGSRWLPSGRRRPTSAAQTLIKGVHADGAGAALE